MADIRVTTTILDDFNRPAENPLTGVPPGTWVTMAPGVRGPLATDGGSAGTNASNNIGGIWYSMWDRDTYPAGDIEVWGGPVGGQAGAALAGWRFGFMMANSVPGSGFNGYLFLREDALGQFTYWRKYTGGNIAADTQGTTYSNQTGSILMCRKVGNTLEAWSTYDASGSSGWTLLNDWTDSTYNGPWKVFIGIEDGTLVGTGWDYFGGGTARRTQIYRWLRAIPGTA